MNAQDKHNRQTDNHYHQHPVHLKSAYYKLNIGEFQESHTEIQNVSVR